MQGGLRKSRYEGDPFAKAQQDAVSTKDCCHSKLQVHPIEQSVEGQGSCCHEHEVGGEG